MAYSKSGTADKNKYCLNIVVFLLIAVIRLMYYANFKKMGFIFPDSASYIDWSFGLRTPGYPFVIDLFQLLLGDSFIRGVVIFQTIVSYLSLIVMYHCLCSFSSNIKVQYLAAIVTVFYGCNIAVFGWDTCILTESIGISCTVIFISLCILWLRTQRTCYGVLSVLAGWGSGIIKASLFVYSFDLLILIVIMLIVERNDKEWIIPVFKLIMVVVVFWVLYSYAIYNKTGVYSVNNLPPIHNLVRVLESGNYRNWPDKEMVKEIDKTYKDNNFTVGPVMELFGKDSKTMNKEVAKFNSYCIKSNVSNYAGTIINDFVTSSDSVFNSYIEMDERNTLFSLLTKIYTSIFNKLSIGQSMCTGLFLAAVLIFNIIEGHRLLYDVLGVLGGIATMLITTYLGSYSEWTRLLACMIPFTYFGIFVLLLNLIDVREET